MTDSLLPEVAVVFSPSLAASIGLEQAILIQHLDQLSAVAKTSHYATLRQGYHWIETNLDTLSAQLPFWNNATIRRLLQDLIDLGMLFVDAFPQEAQGPFAFAINQQISSKQNAAVKSSSYTRSEGNHWLTTQSSLGAHKIPSDWRPEHALREQLFEQGVEEQFIDQCLPEFVLYWQERGDVAHAWSSKFLQYVKRSWQHELQQREQSSSLTLGKSVPQIDQRIDKLWQPSEDALEILDRMGIHRNFIDDAIPEFVLYWQERGEAQNTWNSKFVSHVKRQWARYTHTLKHDTEPKPLADSWQPDQEVFDVLAIANIDASFARSLIPEFVLYWRDKNELHHSWNTRFLQFVKHQWAREYRQHENNSDGTRRTGDRNRKTRDRSLVEDLTDRSWAG